MQRYNLFHQIHKGLRALLFETALHVQRTDFWNVEETKAVVDSIDQLVMLFDRHAHTEDNFVFPAVQKYEPSVADAFEQEHVKDHMLGQLLTAATSLYRTADLITDKVEAAKLVHSSFLRFMVFNIEHMAKEEDILNELLWRYYSDEELQQLTRTIVANVPPELMGQYSKWMLRGLNNPEITSWLREVEKTAPEPVFQHLFFAAEKELPQLRFRQVLEELSEGAMLA